MKKRVQLLTIIAGLLLAAAIVCTHVFSLQSCVQKDNVAKTEQKSDKKEHSENIISVPSISLPTSLSLNLNLDVYYLLEILSEEVVPEPHSDQSALQPQKLFQTLFSVIISPNAP